MSQFGPSFAASQLEKSEIGVSVPALPRENARPSERHVAIYALVDPRDDEIYYVGKAKDPDSRLYGHWIYARRGESSPVYREWMTSLFRDHGGIRMLILQWIHEDRWQDAEKQWIAAGKAAGWPLLNVMPGGSSAPSGDLHWSRREPERWMTSQREIWARKKAEGYSEAFIESRRAGGRANKGRKRPSAVTWGTCECGYTMHGTRLQYHANYKGHRIESFWCWVDPAKRSAMYRSQVTG